MCASGIYVIVFDSYIRQKACATWNKHMSEYFTIENGVKQGGVISPIFFSIYIDPLLLQLRNSGYGCQRLCDLGHGLCKQHQLGGPTSAHKQPTETTEHGSSYYLSLWST